MKSLDIEVEPNSGALSLMLDGKTLKKVYLKDYPYSGPNFLEKVRELSELLSLSYQVGLVHGKNKVPKNDLFKYVGPNNDLLTY